MGSATITLDARYVREESPAAYSNKIDVAPNFIFHAGAGYNSKEWNLSVLWVNDQIHLKGTATDYKYNITTGNYRLVYAKRFSLTRKQKKLLTPIDSLLNKTESQ